MSLLRTMPAPASAVAALPGRLFSSFTSRLPASLRPAQPTSTSISALTTARTFSSTPSALAGPPLGFKRGAGPQGGAGKVARAKRMATERDPKVRILDKALYKLKFIPPPLRMARNRYLRHWTIHRAWLLFRRQAREQRERELMQQYQSMANACEELRLSRGPGLRTEGYLYRVAMEKKGVYRHNGIPVEYARPQTETPALVAWNHDWER
ncbi:ring finger domain protein [Ophiostoma piceae UAMH 11346]|uniref:Ring finger domain protein n=1 Tax=Ophiostoma piceae (strain UAMH 11346) TaxID=1262450 RepID=S3C6A6_OPHP1|nr:ring finger domain protein [Ophiostoma piceae UAMH 11346]